MSLYKSPRSGCWYVSISHGGKRIRCSTGTADKKQAQEWHDLYKSKLWRQERLGEQYTTFAVAALKWEKHKPRGRTDLNILDYLRDKVGDDTDIRSITEVPRDVQDKSESTRRRYINTLSAICRLSGHDPKIKRPVIKEGRIRWLTKAEWKRLDTALLAIAPHLSPIGRFAISTGLRASNILNLEWSQCDLARQSVWIHADQSKSGKPISVPLSKDALRVLKKQQKVKHDKFVFPYYDDGSPITRVSNHGWKSACKAAGLDDIVFHDLRRTWTAWHLMAGTPIPVVQKLGGWASVEILMKHYGHLAASHVAEFANNAKPKG